MVHFLVCYNKKRAAKSSLVMDRLKVAGRGEWWTEIFGIIAFKKNTWLEAQS